MSQRKVDIFFKDNPVGTLSETPRGGTFFTYHETWKQEIACCFPIARRDYEYKQGLHPFFQHLSPEGWLREQQARVAHIVEEDDLGLLMRYGADCIGAVSIKPQEGTLPPLEGAKEMINPGRTISGVQKKLLVTKDKEKDHYLPACARGVAPYIAKFNSLSIPTLVRNEALSLRWATSILGKNEVNQFKLGFILNEIALIVTRFDRGLNGEKLRLEDCAQILCQPKGQDYAGKYNASYEDIAAIIVQHSAFPVIDLARFYKRLIVFTLIGNYDAHLKNFSLLETPEGMRLSPAYDVVNTAMYPKYDRNLALSIRGKKTSLEKADKALFLEFGKAIGLPNKAIDKVFSDLKRQVLKAAPIIEPPDAEDPDGFVNRFEEVVRNGCLRILKD